MRTVLAGVEIARAGNVPVSTFERVKILFPENPQRRPHRIALQRIGLFSLVLALFLQVGQWGIQEFVNFKDSAVSASAIITPKAAATCPHHLHGCPKDCMCPKTYEVAGEQMDKGNSFGVVREPSLVTCTEHGPQSLSASIDVFLLEPAWSISFSGPQRFIKPAGKIRLPDWFRQLPAKIPIA